MGSKTERTRSQQGQTVKIGAESARERNIAGMMERLMAGGMSQIGDLSGLASGQALAPTQQDIQLANQIADATFGPMQAQQRGELAQRGVTGSSVDAVMTAIGGQQRAGMVGQMLMDAPYRRAETMMGANRALLERILGAGTPALDASLRARLAETNMTGWGNQKTTTTGVTAGEIFASPAMKWK